MLIDELAHTNIEGSRFEKRYEDVFALVEAEDLRGNGLKREQHFAVALDVDATTLHAPKVAGRNTVLIGLRDVDERERQTVRQLGVVAFTMRDIDELGLRKVMEQAIAAASDGTAGFHLSLDMDAVDPDEAPGVGTPVRGGMSYREAHLSMEMVCDSGQMLSMEVVEVNPVLDSANRTALLGVELVTSAMGKKIL